MSRAIIRGIARSGATVAEREAAHALGSSVRSGARASVRALMQGGRNVEKAAAKRAMRAGAAQATREAEAAEKQTLQNSVKEARAGGAVAQNADRIGRGAASVVAAGTVAAATGYGIYKANETVDKIENVVDRGIGMLGDGATNLYEGSKEAGNSLLARAEDAAHGLPGSTEIKAGLSSTASTLGNITGSATAILAVGVGLYAAYEIWRFSRVVRR